MRTPRQTQQQFNTILHNFARRKTIKQLKNSTTTTSSSSSNDNAINSLSVLDRLTAAVTTVMMSAAAMLSSSGGRSAVMWMRRVRMMMVLVLVMVRHVMGMMGGGVTMLLLLLLLLLGRRGIATDAAVDVVVVAVADAAAAGAIGSVEFMLLGGMLLDVHHVQILLVVVLEGRRLGHVLVRGRDHLRGDAHHLVVRRLLLVGRSVRRRSGRGWRGLRTRVVLLVGLAGRGRRRGWGGRRQVLDLRRLGRFVDAVRLE